MDALCSSSSLMATAVEESVGLVTASADASTLPELLMSSLNVTTTPASSEVPNDPGKMFIGGLSWLTSPESIRAYFSHFGELAEVMVMKDPSTRRSRGFGFITFVEASSVVKVLNHDKAHMLDGKVVEPKVAVPRRTNARMSMRTRKIFVGGIGGNTTLEQVKSYFEQFSRVSDAMLAFDKNTNRHRGFGFVTFDNDEIVDKICEIHFHEINGKMVEAKKALPRDTRHFNYLNPNGSGFHQPRNFNRRHSNYHNNNYNRHHHNNDYHYSGSHNGHNYDPRGFNEHYHFDNSYGGNIVVDNVAIHDEEGVYYDNVTDFYDGGKKELNSTAYNNNGHGSNEFSNNDHGRKKEEKEKNNNDDNNNNEKDFNGGDGMTSLEHTDFPPLVNKKKNEEQNPEIDMSNEQLSS